MKYLITILSVCIAVQAFGTRITGLAPDHIGDKVRLLRFDDYITKKTVEVATCIVESDSSFTLDFDTKETFEAILEIDDAFGKIYIQPDANYRILFPKIDGQGKRLSQNQISLIFEELPPENDINFLILDLDYRVDGFLGNTYDVLGNEEWRNRLKNFKDHLTRLYDSVQNRYFIEYMVFTIAELELIGNSKSEMVGLNKEGVYHAYIHPAPVLHRHDAYMHLINFYYKSIFQGLADTARNVLKGIILEDVDLIKKAMKSELHYSKPDLREMLLIKGLGEAYMANQYPRSSIINVLEKLKNEAEYDMNKIIAGNMISKLTKLKRGYPAPDFHLPDENGDTLSLDSFKGEYVYISFFETWCIQCQAEFEIMVKLQERYGKHVRMISICMDKDPDQMSELLKSNPEYDWTFLHAADNAQLKEYYSIVSYPIYFLIDPEGNIIQAPALTPSPKGNYESIDRTMFNISKSLSENERATPDRGAPPGYRR